MSSEPISAEVAACGIIATSHSIQAKRDLESNPTIAELTKQVFDASASASRAMAHIRAQLRNFQTFDGAVANTIPIFQQYIAEGLGSDVPRASEPEDDFVFANPLIPPSITRSLAAAARRIANSMRGMSTKEFLSSFSNASPDLAYAPIKDFIKVAKSLHGGVLQTINDIAFTVNDAVASDGFDAARISSPVPSEHAARLRALGVRLHECTQSLHYDIDRLESTLATFESSERAARPAEQPSSIRTLEQKQTRLARAVEAVGLAGKKIRESTRRGTAFVVRTSSMLTLKTLLTVAYYTVMAMIAGSIVVIGIDTFYSMSWVTTAAGTADNLVTTGIESIISLFGAGKWISDTALTSIIGFFTFGSDRSAKDLVDKVDAYRNGMKPTRTAKQIEDMIRTGTTDGLEFFAYCIHPFTVGQALVAVSQRALEFSRERINTWLNNYSVYDKIMQGQIETSDMKWLSVKYYLAEGFNVLVPMFAFTAGNVIDMFKNNFTGLLSYTYILSLAGSGVFSILKMDPSVMVNAAYNLTRPIRFLVQVGLIIPRIVRFVFALINRAIHAMTRGVVGFDPDEELIWDEYTIARWLKAGKDKLRI